MFRGIAQHSGVPQPDNPHLLGGVVSATWADIEPANGVFNWEPVERKIRTWTQSGKQAAIQILLSETPKISAMSDGWEGSRTPVAARGGSSVNEALPAWLLSLGIPQADAPPGTVRPHQYWNQLFLSALQRMVHEMGSHFDGRPDILWVYAAVGCDGRTALEDPSPRQLTTTGPTRGMLWRSLGYSEERWLETICSILTFYRAAFEVTPTVAEICHPFLRQPQAEVGNDGTVFLRENGHYESAVSDLLTYAITQRMWVEYDCRSTDTPPAEPEWRSAIMVVSPRKSAALQGRPVMADLHRIISMGASYALVHATDLGNPRNTPALEWAAKGATY